MKFSKYLKDKIYAIILFFLTIFMISMLLIAFKNNIDVIIVVIIIITLFFVSLLLIDFFRKRDYYNTLTNNINLLDKSYLVLETIDKANFYEGIILDNSLYQINKSMLENIRVLENQVSDFKDYIEMWIHEVKIPVTSLTLMSYNHKDKFDKKTIEQIKRIEEYIEQVLYYVRSENAENDYLIKKVDLNKIITKVALKNKNDFLENKIDFLVSKISVNVYTDAKWLEFIINQIINNSIKYHRQKKPYIKIDVYQEDKKTFLVIEDNGVGIPESDLPRIFFKSFTGVNGRESATSTGMGLYISKCLCQKLGHIIKAESIEGEYTRIIIEFSDSSYYDMAT